MMATKADESLIGEKMTKAIAVAFGEEVMRARRARGWSRPGLAARTWGQISVQAVTQYERGDRQPQLSRFLVLCLALEIKPTVMVGLALQRARIAVQADDDIYVDLHKLASNTVPRLNLFRMWACNILATDALAVAATVPPVMVAHWAVALGVSRDELAELLRAHAPESAPRKHLITITP